MHIAQSSNLFSFFASIYIIYIFSALQDLDKLVCFHELQTKTGETEMWRSLLVSIISITSTSMTWTTNLNIDFLPDSMRMTGTKNQQSAVLFSLFRLGDKLVHGDRPGRQSLEKWEPWLALVSLLTQITTPCTTVITRTQILINRECIVVSLFLAVISYSISWEWVL